MRWRNLCAFGLVCSLGLLVPPLGVGQDTKAKAEAKRATLIVHLPHPNARLTISGAATTKKGKTREFTTPALEPGKQYTYTLVATWRPRFYSTIIRTKDVTVEGGKTIEADLREEDPKRRDEILARYGPTPPEIVDAMCKLAGVGKNDVVYDLGCGDGVIVVRAVKKFGAKKAVGIDINPTWVKRAKRNAKKAGVADKIEVRQGDLGKLKESDIADATVVMLYVGEELNLRLRPLLKNVLKPGARIISHDFDMGDWKPTKTEYHMGKDKLRYRMHLWRIEKKSEEKKKSEKKSEEKKKTEEKKKKSEEKKK